MLHLNNLIIIALSTFQLICSYKYILTYDQHTACEPLEGPSSDDLIENAGQPGWTVEKKKLEIPLSYG